MKQASNHCGTRVPNWNSKTAVRRGDTPIGGNHLRAISSVQENPNYGIVPPRPPVLERTVQLLDLLGDGGG
jgi:hypothetical protein